MATITEDYVSFETAKLLKDKGFDKDWINGSIEKYLNGTEGYSLPTLAIAMKWLREVYHIHTEICLYKTSEDDIEPKKDRKAPYYTFGVWDSVTGYNVDERLINDFMGDTYEQACEAAIKYCIENLI